MSDTKKSGYPEWFDKPIQIQVVSPHDFYTCTCCERRSCGGVYASVCIRCKGIQSQPPMNIRSCYLCYDCAVKNPYGVCKCLEKPPPSPPSPSPTPPVPEPVCCCSCECCYFSCKCGCGCLNCIWRTSSCLSCCISTWYCICCSCIWTWCGCDCSSPED